MITFLGAGVVLGLSAGFSPGPLLALVISQTLQHGIREGVKVSVAPLITDIPIILLSLFVLMRLADYRSLLGVVSLIGGGVVLNLAWGSIRTKRFAITLHGTKPQSLGKGVLVNVLSPHPYLFWLTVGAPTIVKGWSEAPFLAVLFVAGFLGCLVGAKVLLAVLAGRSRHLLSDSIYGNLMRVLGVLLLIFAFLLIKDGLALLGLVRI